MDADENYLDRVTDNSEHVIGNGLSSNVLKLPDTTASQPTTSISLDQTLFKPQQLHSDDSSPVPSQYYNPNNVRSEISSVFSSGQYLPVNSWSSSDLKRSFVSNEIPNVFTSSYELSAKEELSEISKNFIVLTSAGKPLFFYKGNESQLTSITGIINTIVHYFKINTDKTIDLIKSGKTSFVFSNKSPLILVAYSKLNETTSELFSQLDFIYSYLISSLSQRQLLKLFENRQNFDLRNYLEVSDFENLNHICTLISEKYFPDIYLGALQSLPLKSRSLRSQIHKSMLKHLIKNSNLPKGTLLYGLLMCSDNKLISVLRPKNHTLHTTDLQLLFSLISHRFKTQSSHQELWVPICFPKFNSNGFLYCYIKFIKNNSSDSIQDPNKMPVLILISAQKDMFYPLKTLAAMLIQHLKLKNYIKGLSEVDRFKLSDIPAPYVHHFIFKSKRHVQYVSPTIEQNAFSDNSASNFNNGIDYEYKLRIYYQILRNSVIDGETGEQLSNSMLNYIMWKEIQDNLPAETRTEHSQIFFRQEAATVMGLAWVTPKFELYMLCNNGVDDKNVVFKSAQKIVAWCNKNQSRLFVSGGAEF